MRRQEIAFLWFFNEIEIESRKESYHEDNEDGGPNVCLPPIFMSYFVYLNLMREQNLK